MRSLILNTYFLIAPIFLFAQDALMQQFEAGNKAYAAHNYSEAVEIYTELIEQDYQSPELYFNLGNAYYQLNEVGLTILNYEKALKEAPDDEDIQFNLRMANLRVADRSVETPNLFFLSGFKNMLINYASDRWAKLSLIFLWISFLLFAAFLWAKQSGIKRLTFSLGVFSSVLTLVFLVFSTQQYAYQKSQKSAIILETNAYVKSRPDSSSTDLFILREGVKLRVLERKDGWLKVRFSEEKVGWIESEKLALI